MARTWHHGVSRVFHDAAWPQPCRPRRTAQDAALLKAKQNLMEGPVSVELLFQAQLEAARQVIPVFQKRHRNCLMVIFP